MKSLDKLAKLIDEASKRSGKAFKEDVEDAMYGKGLKALLRRQHKALRLPLRRSGEP